MLWITLWCHFHFYAYSLTDQRRANPQVTYLGSYAHDNPNNNTKLES